MESHILRHGKYQCQLLNYSGIAYSKAWERFLISHRLCNSGESNEKQDALRITLASVKQFAMLCVPLKAMTMQVVLQARTACTDLKLSARPAQAL